MPPLDQSKTLGSSVFKTAIKSAYNHIIITDLNGKIIFANPAASRMTGFSVSEMVGNTPRLWGGLMDRQYYKSLWTTIKVKRTVFEGEITNRHKNGTRYIARVRISPILDSSDQVIGFIGTEEDITKEKAADRAKTEFVSLASHQLRTPLTSINWYVEILQNGDAGQLNTKQKELLQEVHHSSLRMVELVNALLNVSRLETGQLKVEPTKTDLIALIKELKKEAEPQVQNHHCQLSLELPPTKIVLVNIDNLLLRQVIGNLITNAIHYSASDKKGQVKVSLVINPKEYLISVADNGIGISPEAQSHVFEKFFRADNARVIATDGNGLGLYLSKQIMDSTGGTIGFSSKLNHGATFYITIPITGMIPQKENNGLA